MSHAPAVVTPGTSLAAALERYVQVLLDQSKADGLRGNVTGAALRRIIARDLAQLLSDRVEGGG